MQNAFFRLKKFPFLPFLAFGLMTQPFLVHGNSTSENFGLMIEKKRWREAENWIEQLPDNDKRSIALYSLQLAHAYGNAGMNEQALALLKSHSSEIEASNLAPYGWMLQARLMMTTNTLFAWEYFEKARQKLAIEEWPVEDANAFYQLKQEREQSFNQELQTLEKLTNSGLYLEALASIDKTLLMLSAKTSEEFDPSTPNGKSLYRHLFLTKAQLLQELKKPEQALSLLDQWPTNDDASMKLIFNNQNLTRHYIRGLCFLDLGRSQEALSELMLAYEASRQSGASAIVKLRAALALSQALHACHQTNEALCLLQATQDLVYECNSNEQNTAHFAWTKQSVTLLMETGQLHKALDQLNFQLKLRHEPRSKAGLILLKARLLELMSEPNEALALYMELFSYPLITSEQQEITQKLLRALDTNSPDEKIAHLQGEFCKLILSIHRPELSEKLRLEVSDWLLRQSLVKPEELHLALSAWLKELEKGPWKAPSLYLLAQVQTNRTEKTRYFQRVLEIKNLKQPLQALAQAQLEYLSAAPAQTRLDNILNLAARCEGKAKEMILICAIDLALENHLATDFNAIVKNISPASALDIVYQEWKLSQKPGKKQSCIDSLKKSATRHDLWGLRASYTLTKTLLETESIEKALEPLLAWSNLSPIHESLKRKAWMQIADIYYQQGNMPMARKYISQILEKWDTFEERPWLQLRQYSEQEYLLGTPESAKCLKGIQEQFPSHTACLTAVIMQAKSIHHLHGYSVQSLKAWEDALTFAQKIQKQQNLNAQAQETYILALIEKSKCLSHLGMQRQALTSLKSAMHSSGESAIALEGDLEKQLRFEIARLHQKLGEIESAKREFYWIWQDPFPSKWQAYAAFELAELELSHVDGHTCLQILENITCYSEEQIQKRLLLAARACESLNQVSERQSYLSQLMKRAQNTSVQEEALWYVYLWNADSPQIAQRALRKISQTQHPLAQKAKEKLAGRVHEVNEK